MGAAFFLFSASNVKSLLKMDMSVTMFKVARLLGVSHQYIIY